MAAVPFVLVFLLGVCSGHESAKAEWNSDSIQLGVGNGYVCVQEGKELKCNGTNREVVGNVPFVRNPRMLSAGSDHACVLDQDGVKCWGHYSKGVPTIPALKNPRMVSAGIFADCALDDEGIKCWGDPGCLTPPAGFHNAKMVSAGAACCAINDEGGVCWGEGNYLSAVPPLKHPRMISTDLEHACALDEDGVKCWGDRTFGATSPPPLLDPLMLSTGSTFSCALNTSGVRCWGFKFVGVVDHPPPWELDPTRVPPLVNPILVKSGSGTACAIDDEGLKCWGSISLYPFPLPALKKAFFPGFSLDQLTRYFGYLRSNSDPSRASFFSSLESFAQKNLPAPTNSREIREARYLLLGLSSEAIESDDSRNYVEKVIPAFRGSIASIQKELGFYDMADGLSKISSSPLHRIAALSVLESALNIAKDFLTGADRDSIRNALTLAKESEVEPEEPQKIQRLLASLDSLRDIMAKLHSSRNVYLGSTVQMVGHWLSQGVRQ